MAPVQYRPVPTMEMLPLPAQAQQYSRSNSETSGSDLGSDRRRDDRRRGRLNAELLTAVLEGNIIEVTKSLEAGASSNATCRPTRTTVLHLAVACGNLEIMHYLLCRGAGPRMRDKAGRQAVHIAAATGNLVLLRHLLDADPGVINSHVTAGTLDQVDSDCLDSWSHNHQTVGDKIPELSKGATPLHLACQRQHLDCVEELLRRGGNVDLPDERGLTPLDVVGEIPSSPSKDILVDLADALPTSEETLARIENMKQRIAGKPSIKSMHMRFPAPSTPNNRDKRTPIQIASSDATNRMFVVDPPSPPVVLPNNFRHTDPAIVINSITPEKKTPSLAQKIANELINNGAKMPKSKVIVKQGEVVNQVTTPMTCLHTAVERQDLALIEYLLDNGACQLTWNNDGLTPLHLAVKFRLLDSLRVLLDRNKSSKVVDARDLHGQTPLHMAVAKEWFAGVSLLLEAGADVKVTSNDSQTVLHVAAKKSETQLLEELLTIPDSVKIIDSRNNRHETPLCCAVNTGQLGCVKLLLSRGADITTSLPGDITLLHLAAETGNTAVLETLLADSRIASFKNIRTKEGKGGTTALHLAALGGYLESVKVLLNSGCDVFVVTTPTPHFGSTALHLAAYKGHCDVVEFIIKHKKTTLCLKNVDGWFPLHIAARFARKDCVKLMLLNGANLAATIFDSGGYKKTALDIIVYSILHPVSFLERIFDCCIEVNEYPLNNPKCVARVSYDVLQPLGPYRKQLRVLDSLLNCGKQVVQEKLLLHPLVETFLYLKWKKLRMFFFLMMALYIVFTVSLTTMSMFFFVLQTQSGLASTCVITCRITLCISLTLITMQELLQATRMQRYYIKDLESWVKWCTFLLSTVVVVGNPSEDWMVHVSAVAVLLSWLELLFLLSRWPSALGFYILMFFTVAKNVIRVLATFTFVILGFTFAFMIHFKAQVPFDNWWEALVKVMVMSLEFEYGEMYQDTKGINATSVVGRAMFLSFMILVAIVLMNLLVGLAVSDIATLEKQGRAQRLAKQIDFLSLLELFVYNRLLFSCCPNSITAAVQRCRATEPNLVIEPGKPLRKTQHFLPQQLRQSVINNIINRKKKGEEDSCDEEVEENPSASDSTMSSAVSNKEEKTENEIKTPLDAQLKNSLELIMSELTVIKREIENLKSNNNMMAAVYKPTEEDQTSRLFRT